MRPTGPLEDRLAIRELLETYAAAVCEYNAASFQDTWSEDAVWYMPDYTGIGTVTGREAIMATWNGAMGYVKNIVFSCIPGLITIDGTHAEAVCYTTENYDLAGEPKTDYGRYADVLEKQSGTWRFKSRTFSHLRRV